MSSPSKAGRECGLSVNELCEVLRGYHKLQLAEFSTLTSMIRPRFWDVRSIREAIILGSGRR